MEGDTTIGSQSLTITVVSMPLQHNSKLSSSASVVVVRNDVEEDRSERALDLLLLLLVILDDIEEKLWRRVFGMFRSSAAATLNAEVETDDQEVCEAVSKEAERREATMIEVQDEDGDDWVSMRRVALETIMPSTRGRAVVRGEEMRLKKPSLGEVNMVD
jgi:hypothetical protein